LDILSKFLVFDPPVIGVMDKITSKLSRIETRIYHNVKYEEENRQFDNIIEVKRGKRKSKEQYNVILTTRL